jgi:hypothetical protein
VDEFRTLAEREESVRAAWRLMTDSHAVMHIKQKHIKQDQ